MKMQKIIWMLQFYFLFFCVFAQAEINLQESNQSFHKMAISLDPFIPGARGITAKGEFEMVVLDRVSFIVPFRFLWIDSEKFPFLFKSGYAHLDPYNYIDDFLEYADSKDIIREHEYTVGAGFKFYPNSKPLSNGFYIKPILTLGYAWLDYEHTRMKISASHSFWGTLELSTNDKDLVEKTHSLVFVPEILVGYNMTFASHLFISLEIGAKYRLFSRQAFVKYVPRLTGFEPSLSFMVGYTW